VIGRPLHADHGFLHECGRAIHWHHLIEPDDMRARRQTVQRAHHAVAVDHGRSVVLGVLATIRRIGHHEIVLLQWHAFERVRIGDERWAEVGAKIAGITR